VSEELLNGPQVQAAFQKMCCVGMAQGVNGGVFTDLALPEHDFKGSVQGPAGYDIPSTAAGKKIATWAVGEPIVA